MPTMMSLLPMLQRYWGYDSFLPNQELAIRAVMERQDSLLILPTGGGKSLCYQLPALAAEGTAVVVSPLVALMKDQVDGLRAMGIAAATDNASLPAAERVRIRQELRAGRLKLLYVSPEALATGSTLSILHEVKLSFIAVDEAHCISHWGHDYREAYLQLGRLRQEFPDLPIHAFTATATPRVREDIIASLQLCNSKLIVGDFHRPNLTYRAVSRRNELQEVEAVLARHPGEAGIIYCQSRRGVDELAAVLKAKGNRVLPYHAGLDASTRHSHQEAFKNEEIDLIVATVAFGMGIDRSNVRFVLHATLPQSVEAYQQEAGRAGRDRLPAECVLLYGTQDLMTWKRLFGAPQSDHDHVKLAKLDECFSFAQSLTCRHRFLVQYFGQAWQRDNCGACDVCLGEVEQHPDSAARAETLLKAVKELRGSFGAQHVADVLHGAMTARIKERGHDQLSCHGSLKQDAKSDVLTWLNQLASQGFLMRGEYQVLMLTEKGRAMLEGIGAPLLSRAAGKEKLKAGKAGPMGTSETETRLFEQLRAWRLGTARQRGIAPYMVFSDATLWELARKRPLTLRTLSQIKGIGDQKRADYGEALLKMMVQQAAEDGLTPIAEAPPAPPKGLNRNAGLTLQQFKEGLTLPEIAAARAVRPSTILDHLVSAVEHGLLSLEEVLPAESLIPMRRAIDLVGSQQHGNVYRALVPLSLPTPHVRAARRAALTRDGADLPPDYEKRGWIIEMGMKAISAEYEALAAQLTGEEPERALAAFALARSEDPRTPETLLGLVANDASLQVRSNAVLSLGRLRRPELLPALERAQALSLGHPDLELAFERAIHNLHLGEASEDGDDDHHEDRIEPQTVVAMADPVPQGSDLMPSEVDLRSRALGSLVGLAVGDALGVTLEFKAPGTFEPLTDMVGGGPFNLPAGYWTDDTSMALCLAASLLMKGGFDAAHQLRLYTKWWEEGFMSSTGECFDIGNTVRQALSTFRSTGDPACGAVGPMTAGNGSLMRLAPIAIAYHRSPMVLERAGDSSRTTHASQAPVDACRYFAGLLVGALKGESKEALLAQSYCPIPGAFEAHPLCPEIRAVAEGSFKHKAPPEIRGTGYVVQSLEAALWAFHSSLNFREGCLLAVNLGDDADTTAAIYGQIAGAYYGMEGIPEAWRSRLTQRERIEKAALKLLALEL